MLESTFQKAQYPDIKLVDHLTSYLNLSIERVNIWFQNRRARNKKEKKLLNSANVKQQEKSNYISTSGLNLSTMPVISYASIQQQSSFRPIACLDDSNKSPPSNQQISKQPTYSSSTYFVNQQHQQQQQQPKIPCVESAYQMKPSFAANCYFNNGPYESINSSFSSGASLYSSPSPASSTSSPPLMTNCLTLS